MTSSSGSPLEASCSSKVVMLTISGPGARLKNAGGLRKPATLDPGSLVVERRSVKDLDVPSLRRGGANAFSLDESGRGGL